MFAFETCNKRSQVEVSRTMMKCAVRARAHFRLFWKLLTPKKISCSTLFIFRNVRFISSSFFIKPKDDACPHNRTCLHSSKEETLLSHHPDYNLRLVY